MHFGLRVEHAFIAGPAAEPVQHRPSPCSTLRPLGLRTHLSSSSPTGAKLVPLTRTIELARIGPKEGTARLTFVRELSLNSTCSG